MRISNQLTSASKTHMLKGAGAYAGATALCLLILVWFMKLWRASLSVSLGVGAADTLFHQMIIKGMLDNGWFLRNDFVGLPMGLDLRDFPMCDTLSFLLMKLLSLVVADSAAILNLFFLLTFPLITLSSVFVLRQFNVSYSVSIVSSLLYTFLPYHFIRGQNHLFLSAYYVVPPVILVILWICSGVPILVAVDKDHRRLRWNVRNRKSIFSIIVCLIVASTGWIYYPYFACFFLLTAGAIASINRRDIRHMAGPALLTALITIGVIINLSPSILYVRQHGDAHVSQRSSSEAEVYALKIAQLVLPISGHRVGALRRLKARYNEAPLVNENDAASLGMIGSLGFMVLIGWVVCGKTVDTRMSNAQAADTANILTHLSRLNICAVLLATIGGFSSLVALLVTPQIRVYNRISIYIAFFSLLTVALLTDRFAHKHVRSGQTKIAFNCLLVLVLAVGILDQTSRGFVPNYAALRAEHDNDLSFARDIEASVPAGSMIFQLPYVPFPEHPAVYQMGDYELFRPYLHSQTLRWSYGTMKNRRGDMWQRIVTAKPPDEMVETLSFSGFSGIYLDRYGFADNGVEIEENLSDLLGTKPLISRNNRSVFFNLKEYNRRLQGSYTAEEWAAKRFSALP